MSIGVRCYKECAKNKDGFCTVDDYMDIFGDDMCLEQGYYCFGIGEKDKCVLQVKVDSCTISQTLQEKNA